ncbi:OLC1v1007421C1 [Oldenlandia corymbosa var. corymbosa]|uniref:OLC1v1007421C1 n=1 Tax=Oldenlandia corymbosa var. corymbosa TaxID=529605 RepID=A0AAV1DJ92_OLDCO|nr:OLC1v1007421C1 [Oldenlandia corymbosa var. corymbosa]
MTKKRNQRLKQFAKGWKSMGKTLKKLKGILEPNHNLKEKKKKKKYLHITSSEYMKLYTTVYNMSTQLAPNNLNDLIYDKYREFFDYYLVERVLAVLKQKRDGGGDEVFLREVVFRWENHKVMVKWVSRFFNYVDRFYTYRNALDSLHHVGLARFRGLIYDVMKGDFRNATVSLINEEREGAQVDMALLKNAIYMFVELGLGEMDCYVNDFECYMLEETTKYYSIKASSWISKDSSPEYMSKAEEFLTKEKDRVSHYLHSRFRALLRDGKAEDISRMYSLLLIRVKLGVDMVLSMFKQQIINEGMVLVQQVEEEARKNCTDLMSGSRQEDERGFIVKSMEMYEKYMSYVIGSSRMIFSFARTFYRKKLSRRLIFDRTDNDDHERLILTKLKQEFGGSFTSKMEGMITDIPLAKEIHSQYQAYAENNKTSAADPGIDLNVMVLTTGFWPNYKSPDLSLPDEMAKSIQSFKEFYQNTTKSRRLEWIYSLGSCHVNGHFEAGTIELVLGTYQAAALLLFNESDKLSYSEIKTQLKLEDEDLIRALQSLSCSRYKILNKESSDNKRVSHTDMFEFNSKFTDKMRRIRFPLPAMDQRKKVVEVVSRDRKSTIEASLVRIMKSRKVLSHQELVQECVQQLSRMFKPDIKAIKKTIENLITRDYLERDKETPNLYKYLP